MFLNLNQKERSKIAVIDDCRIPITYGDICDFNTDFATILPKRTIIFILAKNSIGSLLGYTASLSNLIVPLMLSAHIEKGLYEYLRDLYRPEYLWIPIEMEEDLGYPSIFSSNSYSLVKTGLTPPSLHKDLSLLLPTSGSTGSPKLVRHSYHNIEANAKNVSLLFKITPDDRAMAILPMHYTMGLSVVSSHLYSGATLLISNKSLLDRGFWSMLKEERATSFTGVPYSFEILSKMRFFKMDLPDLRLITQGGGKMNENLFKACVDYAEQTGKKFIATYGQTEGTARMAYLESEMSKYKLGSIGKAIPNGRLSVIDENGIETHQGEAVGEMIYRGENVTYGYAQCPDDLKNGDDNNGMLHTGDIVRRDKDGYYFIIGRKKRFLKIYGLRIGLDEVEHLIKSNFQTDCVCNGTDEMLSVRITNSIIEEEVRNFIVGKIGIFHKSFEIIIVKEIKRNEAGKAILK